MSEPRTEAGRELLAQFSVNERDESGVVIGHVLRVDPVPLVEAIEREAAALAGPGADRPYSTREYLRANLFDGDESGVLTVTISTLLDDLVPVVNEYAALSRSETT